MTSECLVDSNGTRLPTIRRCWSDLRRADEPFPSDSAWLFCACAGAITDEIGGRWFTAVTTVASCAVGYLAVLVCIVCGACRGATKARKARKQNEFELQTLRAAQDEAGAAETDVRFV